MRRSAGSFPDVERAAVAPSMRHRMVADARARDSRDPFADADEMHLGKISPLFHVYPNTPEAKAAGLVDVPIKKAKNVILFIGDGMGATHRTAGRVLAKGYTGGKANGTLAMDRFPYNGLHMTSSLNSLITDSAPGAHNYSTGNKTNNGMEGVFPDNTAANDDNPRIEYLSEFIWRYFGKVTGIVSNAFLTDATPAAFLAHTADRGDGTLVAGQYFDLRGTRTVSRSSWGAARTTSSRSPRRARAAPTSATSSTTSRTTAGRYVDTATALNGLHGRPQRPPLRPLQPRQHERRLRHPQAGRSVRHGDLPGPAAPEGSDSEIDRRPQAVSERLLPHGGERAHRQAGAPHGRRAVDLRGHPARPRRAGRDGLRRAERRNARDRLGRPRVRRHGAPGGRTAATRRGRRTTPSRTTTPRSEPARTTPRSRTSRTT